MAATLDDLLTQFLRERKYLRNLSPETLEWYRTAWTAFRRSATHSLSDPGSLSAPISSSSSTPRGTAGCVPSRATRGCARSLVLSPSTVARGAGSN